MLIQRFNQLSSKHDKFMDGITFYSKHENGFFRLYIEFA